MIAQPPRTNRVSTGLKNVLCGMLPSNSVTNFKRMCHRNGKIPSDIGKPFSALESGCHLSNDISFEFGEWKRLTNRTSSFFDHIVSVFFPCPEKKMIWINARRIVAFMANDKAVRNRPVGYDPSNPVGGSTPSRIFPETRSSVPPGVNGSFPHPAILGFISMNPKCLRGKTFGLVLSGEMGDFLSSVGDLIHKLSFVRAIERVSPFFRLPSCHVFKGGQA